MLSIHGYWHRATKGIKFNSFSICKSFNCLFECVLIKLRSNIQNFTKDGWKLISVIPFTVKKNEKEIQLHRLYFQREGQVFANEITERFNNYVKEEEDIFEFNQDLDNEEDNYRSPGWLRYQKRLK